MRLDAKALAITFAALWGALVLFAGLTNLLWPAYAREFLDVLVSIYPGYEGSSTLFSVLTATGYAIFDGFLLGLLVAWIYNRFARDAGN